MNIEFKWINITIFLVLLVKVVTLISGYSLWDDSYMFTRYADNIVNYHHISWNPDDAGTYGLTSLLYLLVILPVRLIVGSNFVITGLTASIISGVFFLVFLYLLLRRLAWNEERYVYLLMVLSVLTASNLYHHFVTGMDTLFDLAYITCFIIILKDYEQNKTTKRLITLGLLSGLAFFIRPDLLLYTAFALLGLFFDGSDRKERKEILTILGMTVGVVALQILFALKFMNSPLPLPFFAKGTNLYGPSIYQHYQSTSLEQFLLYLKDYWVFYLMSVVYFIIEYKNNKKLPYLDFCLFLGTVCFTLYYLFFVLQIMYYFQRFYYPTLPVLIYLAIKGMIALRDNFEPYRRHMNSLAIIICVLFLGIFGFRFSNDIEEKNAINYWEIMWAETDLNTIYHNVYENTWYKLGDFSTLPDDLVIATSEVGMLSAMNPRKNVIDLVGLNNTDIAKNGFSAKKFFAQNQPDLIYLPHPDYKEINEDIKNDRYFKNNYVVYSLKDVLLEVAIKKDSKYYRDMMGMISN